MLVVMVSTPQLVPVCVFKIAFEMTDGWFESTEADFKANNQILKNSVESCMKTKRRRLHYSCLSRANIFELASDLTVRGIENKHRSKNSHVHIV